MRGRELETREPMAEKAGEAAPCLLTAEEAGEAAALEALCFSDPWSRESLAAGIAEGRLLCLLVRRAGRPAGYCAAELVLDEGELLRICVAEPYRREGIGRQLLEALFARCPQTASWYLEVRQGNRPAVSLYRRMGFEIVGSRKAYYRDPAEDALCMCRKEE